MAVVSFQWQRARRQLHTFCERRNAGIDVGPAWCLDEDGAGGLLVRVRDTVVLRLVADETGWALWVPHSEARWRPYPPCPRAGSIEAVIEELEQAPLHVHW